MPYSITTGAFLAKSIGSQTLTAKSDGGCFFHASQCRVLSIMRRLESRCSNCWGEALFRGHPGRGKPDDQDLQNVQREYNDSQVECGHSPLFGCRNPGVP